METAFNVLSQPHNQNLWQTLNCLMSIRKIDKTQVQSNRAIVQLIEWNSKEICIRTPLRLPRHRQITLEIEISYEHISITMTCLLIELKQADGLFEYRMEHQLQASDRADILSAMNRAAELAHWKWSEAIHTYHQLDIYNHVSPQVDFQT